VWLGREGTKRERNSNELFALYPLNGVAHEVGAFCEAQLDLQVLTIRIDGFHTQAEFRGDLSRAVAVADVHEDFHLAVAEAVHRERHFLPLVVHEAMKDAFFHTFAKIKFSLKYAAHGGDERVGGLVLHKIALRACAKRAFGVEVFIVHREDERLCGGSDRDEVFDEFDAARGFERDIDDDQIGIQLRDQLDRLRGAIRCA
jgi:hypothetical protein